MEACAGGLGLLPPRDQLERGALLGGLLDDIHQGPPVLPGQLHEARLEFVLQDVFRVGILQHPVGRLRGHNTGEPVVLGVLASLEEVVGDLDLLPGLGHQQQGRPLLGGHVGGLGGQVLLGVDGLRDGHDSILQDAQGDLSWEMGKLCSPLPEYSRHLAFLARCDLRIPASNLSFMANGAVNHLGNRWLGRTSIDARMAPAGPVSIFIKRQGPGEIGP